MDDAASDEDDKERYCEDDLKDEDEEEEDDADVDDEEEDEDDDDDMPQLPSVWSRRLE